MSLRDRASRRPATFCVAGAMAAAGAALLWLLPWNAYDSRCSLASRNHPHVRGACAEGAAALMPWFGATALAACVLLAIGVVGVVRSRR